VRQNELPPVPGSIHKKKRLGRGNASGHGTYSGRGIKGQKSRSGPDLRIGFEGGQIPLVRGLSRKRGFNNRFRVEYEPINVGQLNKLPAGSEVTPESLREAGIVKSRLLPVKVLGDGELTVKLNVDVDKVSAGARAKIEAAGGTAVQRVAARVATEVETEPSAPAAAAQQETPAAEPEAAAPRPRRGRARAASEGSSEESSKGEETAEAE
jgi:large subunit ribosomal protein L15